jgi:DNA-directed RNA polymerase subunit RPC12/RpoP
MRKKLLSIHCQHCGTQIMSYVKIGKGRLIRCWKNRIIEDTTIKKDSLIYCPCGQLVGIDKNMFISLKKHMVEIKK